MKYQLFLVMIAIFCSCQWASAQQSNPQHSKVKITTKTKPLPTLKEQVARLEKQVAWANAQPQLVQDGTASKYQKALAEKKRALALEEKERAALQKK